MATTTHHGNAILAFRLSCWGLGTIAFVQIVMGGVGLAARFHRSQEVRIVEKTVTQVVTMAAPPAPAPALVVQPPGAENHLPPPLEPEIAPLPAARGLTPPPIANPEVERLVREAQKARLAGDFGAVMAKLEECLAIDPNEPNALFEQGRSYEEMASYDPSLVEQAADAYQKVYNLGTSGAGSLYSLAAQKLRDGIETPEAMRGQLVLGRPRIFADDGYTEGERVVITVPIRCAPGTEVDPNAIVPRAIFFESTPKDGVMLATDASIIKAEYVSLPYDFATGEELLRLTYVLPVQDEAQIRLYGKRKYCGVVIDLSYKGKVVDNFAWPRYLASMMSTLQMPGTTEAEGADPSIEFLGSEDMVPDFLQKEAEGDLGSPSVLPSKPVLQEPGAVDPYPIPR